MRRRFTIKGTDSLSTLEATAAEIEALDPAQPIEIHLARHRGSQFFKESRIALLIATAARTGRHVTIMDWHKEWLDGDAERYGDIDLYFTYSLAGIAAVTYATRICNTSGNELSHAQAAGLRESVASAGGILEPETFGRGKSLTFCAFDSEWGDPPELAVVINDPTGFGHILQRYRKRYFEVEQGVGLPFTKNTREADSALTSFIFELYQNAFEHGRLDVNNAEIRGLRFLKIQKHIHSNLEAFLAYAQDFGPLQDYIAKRTPERGTFKYYEITIADHGMGLLERFRYTRPDFSCEADSYEQGHALINRLLTTALTSKKDFPGAGYGLQHALRAIDTLEGFISLRTHRYWLYGQYDQDNNRLEQVGLQPVPTRSLLPKAVGTIFNILLPLRKD
jgi:hypothetical protein